jgi:hypothetical protein
LSKLTAEQKVREYNRGQKAAKNGRSRYWSEPSDTRSNPMNIIKDAQRHSTKAMMISFGSNSSGKSLERRQKAAMKVELPHKSKSSADISAGECFEFTRGQRFYGACAPGKATAATCDKT